MHRPTLLLDVDGVISLFGFDHDRPPTGRYALVDGTMHFLSATAAALIVELTRDFELVWCTGWEEKADEHLPAQLGLPRGLAHLTFPTADPDAPTRHWKLAAIDAFAGSRRPLAWIDDAHDDSCRAVGGGSERADAAGRHRAGDRDHRALTCDALGV